MTLIRCAGAALLAALLATTVYALQNQQQAKGGSDKGCNSLRVITVALEEKHLTNENTIEDTTTRVCHNDVVAWHFINPGARPVEIDLRGFRLCSSGTPVKPIKFRGGWFDNDSDATVQPRSSVTMIGRVTMRGGPDGTCVKYDVYTKERGRGRIRHDPRLEIVDP